MQTINTEGIKDHSLHSSKPLPNQCWASQLLRDFQYAKYHIIQDGLQTGHIWPWDICTAFCCKRGCSRVCGLALWWPHASCCGCCCQGALEPCEAMIHIMRHAGTGSILTDDCPLPTGTILIYRHVAAGVHACCRRQLKLDTTGGPIAKDFSKALKATVPAICWQLLETSQGSWKPCIVVDGHLHATPWVERDWW